MIIQMENKEEALSKDSVPFKWLVRTAVGVSCAWLVSGVLIYWIEGQDRGLFGDMFGAVNALFSGLAFSVLIYTMLMQREELKLQRVELRSTRVELAGQKEQMEIQNETLRRQRFEQTYFNLLELFSQSVKSLEIQTGQQGEVEVHGRACFHHFVSRLTEHSKLIRNRNNRDESPAALIETVANNFDKLSKELCQYRSIFEHILSFIETSDLAEVEKHRYAAILQSMLTVDEKILLFYRGLSTVGQGRLKAYIERYALLLDLGPEWDASIPLPTNCYDRHAFGAGTPPDS